MKKVIRLLLYSFLITGLLCFINYLLAVHTGKIIGISLAGGECIEHIGLGINYLELYPLALEGSTGIDFNMSVRFDLMSYLETFIIIFVILQIIYFKKGREN